MYPRLHKDMHKICCADHSGVGLAANQVGVPFNFFYLAPGARVPNKNGSAKNPVGHLCVNPEYEPVGAKNTDDKVVEEEGCLSFPGRLFRVARWHTIDARWTDLSTGHVMQRRLRGWAARVFQHEFDHLLGVNLPEAALGEI